MNDQPTVPSQPEPKPGPNAKGSKLSSFSLRGLLILILMISGLLAWLSFHIEKAKRENEIVERYRAKATRAKATPRLSGKTRNYIHFSVYYAHESGTPNNRTIEPFAPEWLRRFSTDNLFSYVKSIHFNYDEGEEKFIRIFHEDIDWSKLDSVSFRACFKLKDLSVLNKSPNLTTLAIEHCNIEDYSELKNLKKLNSLYLNLSDAEYMTILDLVINHPIERIDLGRFRWSPGVVEWLCKFKSVKHLDLRGGTNGAPKELTDQLHAALPDAKILYNP